MDNNIPLKNRTDESDNVCVRLNHKKRLKTHRNPVQRAASRLYKVTNDLPSDQQKCIGPEFVVRSSLPSKEMIMPFLTDNGFTVTVIMLNGQKLKVLCNPNSTSGQIFEQIIKKEYIEENFMFGLSALISGDFVFLPADTRISKVFHDESIKTLFMRVRFFLPTLRGLRGSEAKHLLYLQLRRSIIEHQLPCSFKQIVKLNAFALQAEFGNYIQNQHGQRDYFLLEHYIPESMLSVIENYEQLRQELITAHISKTGLDKQKAEENFIIYAQNLPHYGGHFYTATWMMKDSNHKEIWLYISAQGIKLFERGGYTCQFGPQLYESFEWKNIQTLCYSKQYLCILPHTSLYKLKKYKLKMDQKKSYFTFRLASLHHQFFLRFRTEYITPNTLSQQFGVILKDMKNESNSMFKKNGETEFKIEFRTSSRLSAAPYEENSKYLKKARSIGDFKDEVNQNTENGLKQHYGLVLESKHLSGFPLNNSTERRRGVKMGTRAFINTENGVSRSMEAVNLINNNDYLEDLSLQSVSLPCSSQSGKSTPNEAYIIDASLKHNSYLFLPNFQESVSESLMEKLNNLSVTEERMLQNVTIERDETGSFGLQIQEGSDGHVYIRSIIEDGPAYLNGNIRKGDQIIAVNRKSLLAMKYNQALDLLKTSGKKVELVLSKANQSNLFSKISDPAICDSPVEKQNIESCKDISNVNKYKNTDLSYHKHIRYETELDKGVPFSNLNKSLSKSCTYLDSSLKDKAVVVHMIPKENIELSNFNYFNRRENLQQPSVALPRSLGLSRKWRGPVKYPVTPIKKLTNLNDISISDEEQVFI